MPFGTNHIVIKKIAERIAPMPINGRRRPNRVRALSDIDPINGSVIPSQIRVIPKTKPIITGLNPNSILKIGKAKAISVHWKVISAKHPLPYRTFFPKGTLSSGAVI